MLTLYHCNGARSMRSLWLLNEMGIAFELKELPFSMEGLRTPEYLAFSPLGRVPCLVDGDVSVFESGAILLYLAEKFGAFLPKDPRGRTEALAWPFWQLSPINL